MTREEIGAVLKELRIASGKTQKEVAEIIGRKQQIVGHWETGYSQPDANTLFSLCEIYGTTVDEAFGFKKENVSITKRDISLLDKFHFLDAYGQETINIMLDREYERVKSLNEKDNCIIELNKATLPRYVVTYYQRMASAGKGMFLFDDIPTDLIEVPDTPVAHMADFVIGVIGDSMEPTYHDGDKVFVKKLDEMPNGNIGIFIKGNDCFIKELGVDRLISHNKDYPDIPASEDIRLVGKVLGKVDELDL